MPDREAFAELAAHIDQVFWMSDAADGRMLYVSPGSEPVWGVPPAELYEHPERWLEKVHPDDRATAAAALKARSFRDDEYRIVWPDGSVRWIRARVFPIRGKDRRVARLAGAAEDITGRRQMEEALRAREAELRQAQKLEAVGRLAGGVAHDFNNILTVIMGYSDHMLEHWDADGAKRSEVEQIKKSSLRAAALTHRLLAFSRRQVVQPRLVGLGAVVNDLYGMLRRLIGDDIDLEVKAPADAGRVLADPGQIEQIVMNLAVNARDAMPLGGKLLIETARAALAAPERAGGVTVPPGVYETLLVGDTGCGMDEATLARIYEPFFTTKEPGKGTGLGLATVRAIVDQARGFIAVESRPGRGTTFRVYLPRGGEGGAEAAEERREPETTRGDETVLIVEDEKDVRDLVSFALAESGYRVLEAGSAAEALWLSQRHHGRIDALVTDIVMRQMNGYDLADRLQPLHPEIKILFMSGYTEYPVPENRKSAPFLEKPFTPRGLLVKLRGVLDA